MSSNTYHEGDEPVLVASFTTRAGVATTPSAVTFYVKTGSATRVTYTEADDNVATPSTGVWECTLPVITVDNTTIKARAVGSGTLNAAAQITLSVAEDNTV